MTDDTKPNGRRDRDRTPPPLDTGIEDLPELTDKQAAFVQAILSGSKVIDAYRSSRDCSGMNEATIQTNSTREHHNPTIAKWLRAARIAQLGTMVITKEAHIGQLTRIRELALEAGDPKAAVAAEHLIGKASGHYVERSELTVYDPAAILAQINSMDPQVATILARRFNIAMPNRSIELIPQPSD